MMILPVFVVTMLAAMLVTPDAPLTRLLHAAIILPLVTALGRVRRRHIVLTIIAVGCVLYVGKEGAQLAAMAMPELSAWAGLVDIGVLLDVGVTMVAAVTITPVRSMIRSWRSSRTARRPRAPRSRPPQRDAANDDSSEDRPRRAA